MNAEEVLKEEKSKLKGSGATVNDPDKGGVSSEKIVKLSMDHYDNEAFIYNARFENDFTVDYLDEF